MADTPHQIKCTCTIRPMVAYLVGTMLTLQVHSAKSAKKSTLPTERGLLGRLAHNTFGPKFRKVQHYTQEMFFDRLENERSVSFLMTQ
jgi:hypothetical protein